MAGDDKARQQQQAGAAVIGGEGVMEVVEAIGDIVSGVIDAVSDSGDTVGDLLGAVFEGLASS